MNDYFTGKKLYGDDFSPEQINQWYEEEKEGYANLEGAEMDNLAYGYHRMNEIHGFDKIRDLTFNNVLGFGSAWGHEFKPVISKISNLTILEPSDNLVSKKIGHLTPTYIKPQVDGRLIFSDNTFDLITCFGTLHHVPNVSFVLGELIRVLQPGGHLLLREPIISLGDWNTQRNGLTKNERGIPVSFFDKIFNKYDLQIVSKEYCFTIAALLQRTIGKYLKNPVYSYSLYVLIDKYLSMLLINNVHYHATRKIERIAPSSIFYVVKKRD